MAILGPGNHVRRACDENSREAVAEPTSRLQGLLGDLLAHICISPVAPERIPERLKSLSRILLVCISSRDHHLY
jgi:hypothetical protein